MSGRLLEAVRVVPPALWRHFGQQFNVAAPDSASLRATYRRRRTLFEHEDVACTALDFHALTEAQYHVLVRVLRDELSPTTDRQRLLGFARRWLYQHRLLVSHERDLRVMDSQGSPQPQGCIGQVHSWQPAAGILSAGLEAIPFYRSQACFEPCLTAQLQRGRVVRGRCRAAKLHR